MADFVKFEVDSALQKKQLEILEKVSKSKSKGKIRIGVNEVTKAIERGQARLVLIAKDTSPAEIVMHIPMLCEEKNIPFSYIETKKELGEKSGITVGTATIAITDDTEVKKQISDITKQITEMRK